MTRYLLGFWGIIIRLCRRDGRVVQGVALELLCRLLFIEGSNPSLSVPSSNSPTDHNVSNQITIDTIIPTVRPLFDRDSLFLITAVRKIPERVERNENLTADPFVIREWEKNPDQTPSSVKKKKRGGGQNGPKLCYFS